MKFGDKVLLINSKIKSILFFCAACILAAAIFAVLFRYDNKYTTRAEVSQDGKTALNYERLDAHELTYLADGWEIFPGKLLYAENFLDTAVKGKKTFIGQYSNFSYFNADSSPYGVATYRLQLSGNPAEKTPYIILFQENFSACNIYVDGILVGGTGSISPYSPHVMDLAVPITLSKDTELIVQIANYTHYYSGMTYPPVLGTALAIHRHSFIRAGFYGLLCFSTLSLALFSIASWFGNRKQADRLYLWFGLLCLSFAVRVSYPFVRSIGVPLVRPLYALEDTAFLIGIWCALKIVLCFCGIEKSKFGIIISKIAIHTVLVGALFPLVVLPLLPTFIPAYGQIIFGYKLLTALLLVGLGFYGTLQGFKNFGWILTGVGVYGTSLLSHVVTLNRFEPAYTGWQDEYGAFGLVLCFAVILVLRSFYLVWENMRLNEHLQEEVDKKTKRLTFILDERRQFLAGAAHDLKAPMSSLQLFAQAIEENGVGLDDTTLSSIRIIRQKSAEMQGRLMEIQSFAMEDAQQRNPELLDFAKLVADFHRTNLPDMEASGVNFLLQVPLEHCMIMGDWQQLWRALQNIVYNALEFTPIDGTIWMTLRHEPHHFALEITDTGSGIEEEDLPHIFDRFFSRRKEGGGFGLGLYLAKSFILEHGGEVFVTSKKEEGTTFTIRFSH